MRVGCARTGKPSQEWSTHKSGAGCRGGGHHDQVAAGLSGEGGLLVSKLAFEEVGSEVPITPGQHCNDTRKTSTSARPSSPSRPRQAGRSYNDP
jgi:hypothetical protein